MKEKLVSWNKVVQKCDDIGKQHEKISQQTADARIFFSIPSDLSPKRLARRQKVS